ADLPHKGGGGDAGVMTAPFTAVYVLTCPGRGRLVVMTYLSVCAFRRVHPEGRAVLLTDPPSRAALAATFPELPAAFDEVVTAGSGGSTRCRSSSTAGWCSSGTTRRPGGSGPSGSGGGGSCSPSAGRTTTSSPSRPPFTPCPGCG